ncbi:polyprenyl synthetase family protein [Nocardia terpenica]|uniref:polyprenyl synthetase family protein n=1 Tax=Nocardia terpenica TaxID=455432 RepID=UPI002816514B|nr:polyprenyl synthetase family protein [Nocardia terpenica]
MTGSETTSAPVNLAGIRKQVDGILDRFLRQQAHSLEKRGLPREITDIVHDFVFAGGKRLRPTLVALGWLAAGGDSAVPTPVIQVAAALELCHTAVLVHDDIIDNSDTRRNRPTVHRVVSQRYRTRPDADRFGMRAAILLGDLVMLWCDEMLHTAQLTPAQTATVIPIFDTMRTDVIYGQYLDLATSGLSGGDVEKALEIVRYKTSSYTFECPLRMGAALADASIRIQQDLRAYAGPLGVAFQLQNDLEGVYGAGASSLDDLREGKHTALLAFAVRHADPAQSARLYELVGNPELDASGAATCREIFDIVARGQVQQMIRTRWERAQGVLDRATFPMAVKDALRAVADNVTRGITWMR